MNKVKVASVDVVTISSRGLIADAAMGVKVDVIVLLVMIVV